MRERLARALRWYWGPGTSTAVSVTGATGSRPQGAVIFSGRQHRGSCEAGAGAVFAPLSITALVAGAGSILHATPLTPLLCSVWRGRSPPTPHARPLHPRGL